MAPLLTVKIDPDLDTLHQRLRRSTVRYHHPDKDGRASGADLHILAELHRVLRELAMTTNTIVVAVTPEDSRSITKNDLANITDLEYRTKI